MKNLLLSVLVLVGTISYDRVLAAVKIPKVDVMSRILAKNLTLKAISKRSALETRSVPASLLRNGLASFQDNPSTLQTLGQIKFELYLLQRINGLLSHEFSIVAQEMSATDTRQQKLPLQSKKSLTENKKVSYYPKVNRSSLIVNSPDSQASSKEVRLVNPAPKAQGIASSFGWRIRPYSGQMQFHKGIDYGAPLGSPVVAAGDGIVTKVVSGCVDFRNLSCGQQFGNRIEIDHGNGAIATYGHLLNHSITITEGTKVWKNQEIAQVGSSGWSSGAHLDFRIEVNGKFQDPIKFVKE